MCRTVSWRKSGLCFGGRRAGMSFLASGSSRGQFSCDSGNVAKLHYGKVLPSTARRAQRHILCASLVEKPPEDFTLKGAFYDKSKEYVLKNCPELVDLVEDGKLMVHTRPDDYVERRVDGYEEPLEVLVLGTCHYSEESSQDVERLITSVKPQNVVVELCRSRAGVMYGDDQVHTSQNGTETEDLDKASNPMGLSGENFFDAVSRSVSLGGPSALALRTLLGIVSSKVSGGFNRRSGSEMRAAQRAAKEVDAQIVLGDRPIEITLERAWKGMSWNTRRTFFQNLLQPLFISESEMESQIKKFQDVMPSMDEDVVSYWMSQLSKTFPELADPLVHERDLYLAWSLKRSKAVCKTKRVVGVVGKGHMRGLMYALSCNNYQLRFRDLVGGKNVKRNRPSKDQQIVQIAGRLVFEVALAYGCYVAWTAYVH